MILQEADEILRDLLLPLPLETFLDEILDRQFQKISGHACGEDRKCLLGKQPAQTLLAAFAHLSGKMGCHAADPLGTPPRIEQLADVGAFEAKIAEFHSRGYTVRLPEIRALTGALDRLIRAFEIHFQQPAGVEAFWSRGGAKAPIHYDDYDLIAVQLAGHKVWFVAKDPSPLPNIWRNIPDGPPRLDRFEIVEMEPGDLLYLPRGTMHRVESRTESIHLSIGFVPVTVRDAMIACIDRLSDIFRPIRESAGGTIAAGLRTGQFGDLPARVRDVAMLLMQHCANERFVIDSMQQRSSTVISKLGKLPPAAAMPPVSILTRLRQTSLAASHITSNGHRVDFAYPGGHHYIHGGAEESVVFIANTPEFCVRDIPGQIGNDVRIALAEKFVNSGFLEVVE